LKAAKRPSPAEPVSELRRVKIVECGEPLVDFLKECPKLVQAKPVFEYERAHLVRKSVAEVLAQAADSLPKGYFLGVLEGWRPGYIQRRMWHTGWLRFKKLHPEWSDHQLKRIVNRYVAPPDAKVPPPHSTGRAVDVFLVDKEGERLDHSSPFAAFDPAGYALDGKGLSQTAKENRRILREALEQTGLTNYPSEWWHWSYGDQGWAYRAGDGRTAFYGRIDAPIGWSPVPEDDVDEPLLRLYQGDPASGFPRVAGRSDLDRNA